MHDPRVAELLDGLLQLSPAEKVLLAADVIHDAGGLNDAELYRAAELILTGVLLELAELRRSATTNDDVRH